MSAMIAGNEQERGWSMKDESHEINCYNEGWNDAKADMPLITDKETIITALRKARIYIRSVEAWQDNPGNYTDVFAMIKDWSGGGEVEAIEAALAELGIIV